jgi:hypothetical protein
MMSLNVKNPLNHVHDSLFFCFHDFSHFLCLAFNCLKISSSVSSLSGG